MALPVTSTSVQKRGQVGTLTEAVQVATGPPSPSWCKRDQVHNWL
jgi:hypothetical protein